MTNPTTGLMLRESAIRAVDPASAPLAPIFRDGCATYLDAPMFDWGDGCVLYDPLAVVIAADPGVGSLQDMAVAVTLEAGPALGQTTIQPNGEPNMRVCVAVDGAKAVEDIIGTILAA